MDGRQRPILTSPQTRCLLPGPVLSLMSHDADSLLCSNWQERASVRLIAGGTWLNGSDLRLQARPTHYEHTRPPGRDQFLVDRQSVPGHLFPGADREEWAEGVLTMPSLSGSLAFARY